MITELLEQINENTLVITPNRRLSATLNKFFQGYQIEKNKTGWKTPCILPVNTWIQSLWQAHTNGRIESSPYLLSAIQEQLLWEKTLQESNSYDHLLQLSETAEIAKSASHLLTQWELSTDHPQFTQCEDYLAFASWSKSFKQRCKQGNLSDASEVVKLVSELIAKKIILPPSRIMLYGFSELSPQIIKLIASCQEIGSEITHHTPQINQSVKRITLQHEDDEITSIARWANSIYNKDKNARIGCVLPKLDKRRDRIFQIFMEIFNENNSYPQGVDSLAFNVSAGKSLAKYPIIYIALQILSLNRKLISTEMLAEILSSPFIGEAEEEKNQRYRYESFLRENNVSTLAFSSLTNAEDPLSPESSCPLLANRIRQFSLALAKLHVAPFHIWASQINVLLKIMGWPGERSLNSEEYQTVEAWTSLMTEFSCLDYLFEPVNCSEAVNILKKMCHKHFFQPESPETNIQILGLLEAACLPFDYLWVAGMDDTSWPAQPSPNPFIPKILQREHLMPHSSSDRELQFSNILTSQFIDSAKHVVFSHAKKLDNINTNISPLLTSIPNVSLESIELNDYQSIVSKVNISSILEELMDNHGAEVSVDSPPKGGVDILKQQALCPFKAYATYRLHARPLETVQPGLRNKDRGKLIHRILELFWNQTHSHEHLCQKTNEELKNHLLSIIDLVFNSEILLIKNYSHAYLELEKSRLLDLIYDWLGKEKEREAFTVEKQEKKEKITIGKLSLSIRIDRVDSLINGQHLIIDYKTGKSNSITSWLGERPEEPQLPLYALIDPKNTAGIAFAQVATGQMTFIGFSRYPLNIPGIKTLDDIKNYQHNSWDDTTTEWKKTLEILSDHFVKGDASLDPKHPKKTCLHCKLKPLCRINENAD